MLLMCLPFVIYSASMQIFLDSMTSPVPVRLHATSTEDDS